MEGGDREEMSAPTVDERVVQLRFDNKDFESNAKTSLDTLGKLKNALNFSTSADSLKSVSDLNKTNFLDNISNSLGNLEKRFGAFGTFTGRIIENLADGVTGVLNKGLNYVKDSIIAGGIRRAQNIENAHFSLQALLKDEVKVQEIMDNAMQSVDGTAYAYDEAAKAAASFAATGIEGGEQMTRYLKGITGVAAMTNAEYEGISRIFTTVAGNGRLMGDQLLQLSSRGLNAAATIADYFKEVRGQTDMTEMAIRDMVSKGMISFDDFASAMEWAFGESAFRANETFTGALANMKSAFARIGAEFIAPLVAQNSELVKLFNTIRVKVNEFKKLITFGVGDTLSGALGKSFATQFTDNILKAADAIGKFISKINAKAVMRSVYNLRDGFVNFGKAIFSWVEPIGKAFGEVFGTDANSIYGRMRQTTQAFKDWTASLSRWSLSDGKNGLSMFQELKDLWKGLFDVAKLGITIISGLGKAFSPLLGLVRPLVQVITALFGALGRALQYLANAGQGMLNFYKPFDRIRAVTENVTHVFSELGKALAIMIQRFTDSSKIAQFFQNVFSKISSTLQPYIDKIGEGFDNLMNKMQLLTADDIVAWFDTIGEKWQSLVKWFNELPIIQKLVEAFKETFNGENIAENWDNLLNKLKEVGDWIGTTWTTNLEKGQSAFENFKNTAKSTIDWIKKHLTNPFQAGAGVDSDTVFNAMLGIGTIISALKFSKSIGEFQKEMMKLPNSIADVMKELKNTLVSYQKDIDATRLLKIAAAVGIFAVSIGVLANVSDWKSLAAASLGLAAVAAAILFGMAKLEAAKKVVINNGTPINDTIAAFGSDLGKALNTMVQGLVAPMEIIAKAKAYAIRQEALRKFLRDFGITLVLITGCIAAVTALAYYRPDELMTAVKVIGGFMAGLALLSVVLGLVLNSRSKNLVTQMSTLNDTLRELQKGLNAKLIASAIRDICASLIMIAGAIGGFMALLAWDPNLFSQAMNYVAAIGLTLVAITAIMPKVLAFESVGAGAAAFSKASRGILAIIGALYLIVGALGRIVNMEFGDHWQAKIATLAGIMGGIAALIAVMAWATKKSDGNAYKGMLALAAVGGTIYLVVMALDKLFKMDFDKGWISRSLILAGIISAMYLLINLLGGIAKDTGGKSIKGAATVLALAVTIGAIVISLKTLESMEWKGMLRSAIGLGLVMVALGACFAGMRGINKDIGKTVMNMAVIIGTITAALGILSMIRWQSLLKAVVSLSAVLMALGITFEGAGLAGKDKTWASILAMAAMIGAVTAALYFLAEQPWQGLITGAASLGVVLLSVGVCLRELSKITPSTEAIMMFATAVAMLGTIAISLMFLADKPWQALLSAAVAMTATLLATAGVLKIIAHGGHPSQDEILGYLSSMVAIIPIAIVLSMLADHPWQGLLAAAAAVSLTLAAFAGVFVVINKFSGTFNPASILIMAEAVIALLAVGYILQGVASENWEGLIPAAIACSGTLLAMCVAMAICSLVGGFAPAAIAGIAALDIFIANYAGVVAAMGALWSIPGFQKLINGGIDMLVTLCQGIGRFVGAVVEGFMTQVSAGFAQVGKDLSDFMINATPFFTGLSVIPANAVTAAKSLADLILAITVADVINGIKNFLGLGGDSLASFGEELAKFGPALQKFARATANVNADKVKGAAEATVILARAAEELPNSGGWLAKIVGENSIAQFGFELSKYGPYLASFASAVANVSAESVQGAADATIAMADAAMHIENQGGIASWIFGDNNLAMFGAELMAYGPNLASFAAAVQAVKLENVEGAALATERLAAMATTIPNSGGALGFLMGENGLEAFGLELKSYGMSLAEFCAWVNACNWDAVWGAIAATTSIISLFSNMKGVDKKEVKKFNAALAEFAKAGIKEFTTAFDNGQADGIAAVEAFLKAMEGAISNNTKLITNAIINMATAMINTLQTQSMLIEAKARQVGERMCEALRKGIRNKWNSIMTTIKQLCAEIIRTLDQGLPAEKFVKIGERSADGLRRGFDNKKKDVVDKVAEIAKACIECLEHYIDSFEKPGTDSMNKYAVGISKGESAVKEAVSTLAKRVIDVLTNASFVQQFENAGKNAAMGFANGIADKAAAARIESAARELGNKASRALNARLEVKSPSRVTTRTGEYFSEGLAVGIVKKMSLVDAAATNLAKAAVNALNNIEGVFEIDPVITPYLDLSQINKDMNDLNRILENGTLAKKRVNVGEFVGDNVPSSANQTFNFTQNNYSPTALSRAEIYRQTNNQFSRLKGMVSTV